MNMKNEKIRTNLIINGKKEKFLEFRVMVEFLFDNRNHISTKYPDASKDVIDLKSELNTMDNLYLSKARLQDEVSNNDKLTVKDINDKRKRIKLIDETLHKVQDDISWYLQKIAVFLSEYDHELYCETYSWYSRQALAEQLKNSVNNVKEVL